MNSEPAEILKRGRVILDPVLQRYGFEFVAGPSGLGSGGRYASGAYVNGNRRLEFHYLFSLGLATYHFGEKSIDHEFYMRALLGTKGGNRYPGFSGDPMDAFKGIAYDVQNFATAFLEGNREEFERHVIAAEELKKIPGFARLS